jgi:hypothetical protein
MITKYPILWVLLKDDLRTVSNNFSLTNHARKRINQRFGSSDTRKIRKAIIEADFAYVAGDRVINVGLKDGTIFKLAQEGRNYIMITYLDPSMNGVDIRKKYRLACRGGNR